MFQNSLVFKGKESGKKKHNNELSGPETVPVSWGSSRRRVGGDGQAPSLPRSPKENKLFSAGRDKQRCALFIKPSTKERAFLKGA